MSLWLTDKVGRIVTRLLSHDVLVFLFFFIVAAGFWLLQTLNDSFEMEMTVPVRLEGVPDNVLITTEPPTEINVTIQDRGSTLVRYWRRHELKPIVVEFGNYDNGAVTARIQVPHAAIQRAVEDVLEGTSRILSIRPDTFEFYYNRGLHYRLPVRVSGTIEASPQNYLMGVECIPDSVDVYAPTALLDTMTAAFTKAVMFKELTSTITENIQLIPIKGVRYDPQEVSLTALVDFYTEKTIEVPIIGLNFPADKALRTFPAKAKLTFRVGSTKYNQVNAENFVLATTYEELLQNQSEKYQLHLKSLPQGVSNVRINPREVDYLIENVVTEEEEETE